MLKSLALFVAILAGSLLLAGCHAERPPSSVEEAPYQLTADGTLRIREDLMPMLRFAKVQRSNILAELPGVGDIAFAPGAMVAVRVPFDGIVESVEVFAGQTVAVDQVLARIRSSELAKMRADIRRLTAELGGEYDAVKRASVLVAKEAISNRKVVELEATIGGLEAQRTGLLVALRSARATEEGEDLFELRSPRAGQVIQRKIDPGEHAHDPAHEPAFVVVDPHNLIVHASYPERDAPLLREGFACRIEVPSLGQVCFEGQVRSVVQAIDPTNRTVQVLCGFNSPDRRLRSDMLARVTIVVQGVDLLVVPRESVLLRRDMRVVLVRRGDRELERRPVVVGSSVAATLEISSGLSEGEEIVVEGAVLLDGELDRLLQGPLMFDFLIHFAVDRWKIVLALTAVFCLYAWNCFRLLPIEAFPDVTDPMVEIVGLYPGQAAEEVERRVTVELERVLAGTPKLIDLRSASVFGLGLVTLTFEDGTTDFELRTCVAERLREATLPQGASCLMGPQSTPVGQIYRYTLRGPRSLKELRAIQDFVVERRLRGVPGVADVITFGGYERNYQVRIDPIRLSAAGVSIETVYSALAKANENAGGGYIPIGSQEFVVRGLGVVRDPAELGNVVVSTAGSVPLRVRDVAEVLEGSTPRRGAVGRGHNDEVVEGVVLLRRGVNPSIVLDAVHERVAQLNREVLPKDVQISVFYDRTWLVDATLSTVGTNLLEGGLLVLFVVYAFLRSLRAVAVVAVVIPVSLLSAFVGLKLLGLPANLISLGAIDFGILVDGAIIVLEATLHAIDRHGEGDRALLIRQSAAKVARPVAFAMLIIIVALFPIFFLERVEGRIFAPMAFTYAFALAGALLSAMVVVPALERLVFRGQMRPVEPRWLVHVRNVYLRLLDWCDHRRWIVLPAALAASVGFAWYASGIGTEFLPELNEGGIFITTTFPSTIALDETRKQVATMRELIMQTPEVIDVLSHIGRPESTTQTEGPNIADFNILLSPEDQWRPGFSRTDLEFEVRRKLTVIAGAEQNFSQPITNRVFETISGIIGQVVVKVKGADLVELTNIAEVVRERLSGLPGVTDLALFQAGDVPTLRIDLNREALARRGLAVEEVQRSIRIALGGEQATELWDGERRFPVSIRLPGEVRANLEVLGRMFMGDPDDHITLAEIATIDQAQGRAAIWREDFTHFVAVKFNVRGRDLGSTVEDAQRAIRDLELPQGIALSWGGEFQNQRRAMFRLGITLPIALTVILGVLFANFGRWSPTITIFIFLPLTVAGAVAGLRLLGENFSVSSAVGCIALLGQVVLSGVIYCSGYLKARQTISDRREALLAGALESFRPVFLTTMLAMLGLVPAALSHAMGSETQRPFAIAIVGGLLTSLPAVTIVLPVLFSLVAPRPRGAEGIE